MVRNVNIVPIGNSKGVRIPKAILEQCEIENEVELEVNDGKIIIRPLKKIPRQGWSDSFCEMTENDEDDLLIDDWEW